MSNTQNAALSQTQKLINFLDEKYSMQSFLLVIDSFERINNDEIRKFLGELVRRVRKVRCLITSRVQFNIVADCQVHEIAALDVPNSIEDNLDNFDAYRLLCIRALQYNHSFTGSKTDALIHILQATEGLPLCIEFMAARCAVFSLERIGRDLAKSVLDVLCTMTTLSDSSSAELRHESLYESIDWSFQLLPEMEQEQYFHLSNFSTDFDAEAARKLADISEDCLIRWTRCYLLQRDKETELYTLTPLLREFIARRRKLASHVPPAHSNTDSMEQDNRILPLWISHIRK